jgi:hypothetical protein
MPKRPTPDTSSPILRITPEPPAVPAFSFQPRPPRNYEKTRARRAAQEAKFAEARRAAEAAAAAAEAAAPPPPLSEPGV